MDRYDEPRTTDYEIVMLVMFVPVLRFRRLPIGLCLGATFLLLNLACASRSANTGPETGTVTVGVTTQGSGIEKLIFSVDILPAGTGGPIQADSGVFTARNTPAGDHIVRLTGLPARCRVEGGTDRTIRVAPERSATVRFVVKCS